MVTKYVFCTVFVFGREKVAVYRKRSEFQISFCIGGVICMTQDNKILLRK